MNGLNVPQGQLKISWYISETDCLGPGVRFAIWVQGCYKRCKNCIAASLQDTESGELIMTETLAEKIIASNAHGISISGGEPFLQASELRRLVMLVRAVRPELSVIVYTGYLYEELMKDNDSASLLSVTDILVDGAYIDELNDGLPMRGSSNQRVLFLTERYNSDDLSKVRKNKIIFSKNSFRVIGIPSSGTMLTMDAFMDK